MARWAGGGPSDGRSTAVQDACGRLNLRVRHKVRSLNADDRGNPNVEHFMSADIPDWFLPGAELTVTCVELAGPEGAPLTEPRHQDGGASVCHMSITLYGSRTLRCEQGSGADAAGVEGNLPRKLARHALRIGRLACSRLCRHAGSTAHKCVYPTRLGFCLGRGLSLTDEPCLAWLVSWRSRSAGHPRRERSGHGLPWRPHRPLAPGWTRTTTW